MTIGETIADPDDPRPLPVTTVDEPSLSVTIGINTSPLAGTEGDKADREPDQGRGSTQELVGNVSLRVLPTSRPDAWEVQGRGELQLAVLVELMRREGFELTVGKPEVLTKEVDGKRYEPVERVAIDVPEEYIGVVTQLLALRKGRLQQMVNHGTGWARMEYLVPARGLIGFRTEFLTETRGTGILHHVFEAWEPWHGELRTRPTGQPRRRPPRPGDRLRDREPPGARLALRRAGDELYEGMIVGENSRDNDLDVNASKPKKLTNMRASSADELVRLIPPRPLSLEQALEFIRDDEAVEVTPKSIRLRKVELSASKRQTWPRARSASARAYEGRAGGARGGGVARASGRRRDHRADDPGLLLAGRRAEGDGARLRRRQPLARGSVAGRTGAPATATATGNARANDCDPYCAAGTFRTYPVERDRDRLRRA